MSSQTTRSRASGQQLSLMLDFLGENPSVASGKFQKLHGNLENIRKWTEMAEKLNTIGGAVKSAEQWKNVWRDLKSRTSTRVRDRKREQASTGNLPLHQPPLTDLEKRIIALVGNSYMEGQPDVEENIRLEEELQLNVGAAEDNFQLIVEEKAISFALLTVSEGGWELHCETPQQTPRRTAKRRRAEQSPTRPKFLKIAEAQAESERMHAESASETAEAVNTMAAATESMATATTTMAQAFRLLAEGVKAFSELTRSLGPPQSMYEF